MEKVVLNPSKRPTVSAVGVHFYKDSVRLSSGIYNFEIVPEPDNPHDANAISIRYNGSVVGYIPRDRTSTYLPIVSRIAASDKTAVVKGKYYRGSSDYVDISLYLLSSDKALPPGVKLIPKARRYAVPNAFQQRQDTKQTTLGNTTRQPRSPQFANIENVTFTEAERQAEQQRRNAENAKYSHPSNSGCGTGIILLAILLILIA